MAVTHPTATRNAIAELIRGLANTGAQCTLRIYTSGDALLVEIPVDEFGAASTGTITSASSGNQGTATGDGTASYGAIEDDSGPDVEIFRGACGVGSGEVQLNTLSISVDDLVTLTSSITYTAPS